MSAVVARIPEDWNDGGMAIWARYTLLRIQRRPEEALAIALAGLRRSDEALSEARIAMDLAPLAVANPLATAIMAVAAEIFVQAGKTEAAMDLLEVLLAMLGAPDGFTLSLSTIPR